MRNCSSHAYDTSQSYYVTYTVRPSGWTSLGLRHCFSNDVAAMRIASSNRFTLLENLTAAFSRAASAEEVADLAVAQGVSALNACVGILAVLNDSRTEFSSLRIAGCSPEVVDAWRRFPATAAVPIADVVRDNRPLFLTTLEERLLRYPLARVGGALVALPIGRGNLVGGLGFTFPTDRPFTEEDFAFLGNLAELCGQGLERVRLHQASTPHVLLVDDDPSVRQMLDLALSRYGVVPLVADGSETAVEVFRKHAQTIEVVLLDVQMPGADGPQTLAALRQINPHVRCCFMSGFSGKYSEVQLLAMGASQVFVKPFKSLEELARRLREAAGS
jgi:two-component system, OmpR family, response regulator